MVTPINTGIPAQPVNGLGSKTTRDTNTGTSSSSNNYFADGFYGTANNTAPYNSFGTSSPTTTSPDGPKVPPQPNYMQAASAQQKQFAWAETTAILQRRRWDADKDSIIQAANPDNLIIDATALNDYLAGQDAALTTELAQLPPGTTKEEVQRIIDRRAQQIRSELIKIGSEKTKNAEIKQATLELNKLDAKNTENNRKDEEEKEIALEKLADSAKPNHDNEELNNKLVFKWA